MPSGGTDRQAAGHQAFHQVADRGKSAALSADTGTGPPYRMPDMLGLRQGEAQLLSRR